MEQTIKTPKKKHGLTTTRIIALGFACAILVGGLILMLPVSSADGSWTKPIDALFTATTSICVTGLVTVTTAVHWSFFGQLVIMILAQLGGLGVITAAMCIMLLLRKKITLKDRMLIQDHGGDLLRRIFLSVNVYLVIRSHMSLDGGNGAFGVGYSLTLCRLADQSLTGLCECYDGRSCTNALCICDNNRLSAFHNCHT